MPNEIIRKPKDDLRDDVGSVFSNSDDAAEDFDLTDPEVAIAAFKAVYFDNPTAQNIQINLKK
jgi:hypothetical protein